METTVNLWVAKDQDGSLWLFSEKPTRAEKEGSWICDGSFMMLPRNLEEGLQFSGLTWESEPVKVRLIIPVNPTIQEVRSQYASSLFKGLIDTGVLTGVVGVDGVYDSVNINVDDIF